MGNIIDYVKWRRDLTFEERPLNIVDNLVFSFLAYLDLSEIYEDGKRMTLGEIWQRLGRDARFKYLDPEGDDADLLEACGNSDRFGNIVVSDYEDYVDQENGGQFAAMTFHINEEEAVIAFRGTDETIVGWKEDFMMSYTKVPSQDRALRYCRRILPDIKRCYIAGHSKGANLALFSAAHLNNNELSQVEKIFLNDGPGFCREFFDGKLIDRVDEKCVKITPRYCVVGAIFEPRITESYIINSTAKQLMQHGIMSWEVDADWIVTTDTHDISSTRISELFDGFISKMDKLSDRQTFVDSIFDTMSASGAVTLADFVSEGPLAFENLIVSVISGENGGANPLKNVKSNIVSDIKNTKLVKQIVPTSNRASLYKIGVSALIGILCLIIPRTFIEAAFATVVFALVVFELVMTLYHLYKSSWDFAGEKIRINTCIALVVAYLLMIVKDGALYLFSSILLGTFFWIRCNQFVIKYKESRGNKFLRCRYMLETILTFIFGGYLLVAPKVGIEAYTISCGSFFLLEACFDFMRYIDNKKDREIAY